MEEQVMKRRWQRRRQEDNYGGGEGYGEHICRKTLGPWCNVLFHLQISNVSFLKKINKTSYSNK